MKTAFTICSANYLPQALSLEASIIQTNPQLSFYIFLTDKKPSISKNENIIEIDTIGFDSAHFEHLIATYNIIEFNTAVKAQCFLHLINHLHADVVLYFDPDILVFSDLSSVWNELNSNNVILTPHLLKLIDEPELNHLTKGVINTGVFNLGFIGLNKSEQTLKFLHWWNKHLREFGHNNILNGEFYDQKVINLLPCALDKVIISKNAGLNVAEWNLHERKLSFENGTYLINDTTPLVFFHFSGVKITNAQENLSRNPLFNRSKNAVLEKLLELYIGMNQSNEFDTYKSIVCHYKLRPNIHRASRLEIYKYRLKSWLKSK